MHLTRYHDLNEFYTHAEAFLEAHEAAHCLHLGIINNLRAYPKMYNDTPPYLATIEHEGQIVGVMLRTPPFNLQLSMMDKAHWEAAFQSASDDVWALYGDEIPGIGGPSDVVKAFVEGWQARTQQHFKLEMGQRIYKLTQVNPVTGVPGRFRPATGDDRDLLVEWMYGFQLDAFLTTIPVREDVARIVNNGLSMPEVRGYWIWEDESGKPVSFAGHTGPTPHGIRIGPVYTPAEFRRKGYASACVAALSQYQLDHGRDFCFLFTDLANPTSNKIYMDIGYVPVIDYDVYRRVEKM